VVYVSFPVLGVYGIAMVLYWQVSAACEKMYTVMAEVIKKVINYHGLGCWWGVCGYGFWYLGSRWTPSVGVSVSSVFFLSSKT
jgi:hypothetical protein